MKHFIFLFTIFFTLNHFTFCGSSNLSIPIFSKKQNAKINSRIDSFIGKFKNFMGITDPDTLIRRNSNYIKDHKKLIDSNK
ncbi:hypothetical protein, partial [Fusobacterium sp.]|uniref:hypothetical protein n=1 Tax=Fusobacterium sp. TaxID=68766 RepID=UPI00260F929B